MWVAYYLPFTPTCSNMDSVVLSQHAGWTRMGTVEQQR